MPINPIGTITRQATRKPEEKLNILCAPTHERYESSLALTGHNFYAFQHPSFKGWKKEYAKLPENYTLLDKNLGVEQIPAHLDFDLVLSQNKFGQFQILTELAKQLHLPILSLEHTLPIPVWPKQTLDECRNMRGAYNVFISEYSIGQWGWDKRNDTHIIRHALDSEVFKPADVEKTKHVLTVANDYIGRDWCLNFRQYQEVIKNFPAFPVGDTPGLSRAAKSTQELIGFYQKSQVFLNTAHISPIPTSLLEAMSCGCACVSVRASEIPYYIKHGENGFLYDTVDEARDYIDKLLKDDELAKTLGQAARETILKECNINRFTQEWNHIFKLTSEVIYKG